MGRQIRPLVECRGDTRLVIHPVSSPAVGFHILALMLYLTAAGALLQTVLAPWLGSGNRLPLPPGEMVLTLLMLLCIAGLMFFSVRAIVWAFVGLEVLFDNDAQQILRNGRAWCRYGAACLELLTFDSSDGGPESHQLRVRAGRRRLVLTRQLSLENSRSLGLRIAGFSGVPFDPKAILR